MRLFVNILADYAFMCKERVLKRVLGNDLDLGDEVDLEFFADGFLGVVHEVEDFVCGGFAFVYEEVGVFF